MRLFLLIAYLAATSFSLAAQSAALQLPSDTIRDEALYRFLLRGQGYFKNAFEDYLDASDPLQQLVKASVFKTQSGFSDQKYYVITNLAPANSYVYLYADAQGRSLSVGYNYTREFFVDSLLLALFETVTFQEFAYGHFLFSF